MSSDNERDIFGNARDSANHTEWAGKRAGVLDTDSAEVGRHKVAAQEARDKMFYPTGGETVSSSPPYDFGAPSGKDISKPLSRFIKGLFVICVLMGIAAVTYDSRATWENHGRAEAMAQRVEMYSDFSPIEKWPRVVQERYGKFQQKPLLEILRDAYEKRKALSTEAKAEYGAQIWFSITGHGKQAHAYARKAEDDLFRMGHKMVDSEDMVLSFLHGQCKGGVVVACLDAAKVQAAGFFRIGWYDMAVADGKALAELSAADPSANASELAELRSRIARGPDLHGWGYLESIYRKFKRPSE